MEILETLFLIAVIVFSAGTIVWGIGAIVDEAQAKRAYNRTHSIPLHNKTSR